MAELWLTALGDTQRVPLYEIGPYGAWGDLKWQFRWGEGACGMFEAPWTMPLAADFEHPLLRRGTRVEVKDGPWRMGSPLVLSEPSKGTGFDQPWQFVATGVGRQVEGENSFYADDGAGNATAVPSTAATTAMGDGWAIDGVDSSVPSTAVGADTLTEPLNAVGNLLTASADGLAKRWGVGQDNVLRFYNDPALPIYRVIPEAAALGTSDDEYASTVKVRYWNSSTNVLATAIATNSQVEAEFGHREFPYDISDQGPISTSTAQAYADGILAKSKGRLAWTNGLTLTSNEILTWGGEPADLAKVAEDVGTGCVIRLDGIFDPFLAYNGRTWLDIIAGDGTYADGAATIDVNPLGLAARNLAAFAETITRKAS